MSSPGQLTVDLVQMQTESQKAQSKPLIVNVGVPQHRAKSGHSD